MKTTPTCHCGRTVLAKGLCRNHYEIRRRKRLGVSIRARERELYAQHRERNIQREKDYQARVRQAVLDAYGNTCACCGETEQEFLQLDHINGGGRAHRRSLGSRGGNGMNVYRAVRDAGYPKDRYRLLCSNCNFVRRHGRACPHERARLVEALLAA